MRNARDLMSVPYLFVAGQEPDLCIDDRRKAVEMLVEQIAEGVDAYAIYYHSQLMQRTLMACLTADTLPEAKDICAHVASIIVQREATMFVEGRHGTATLAQYSPDNPHGFKDVHQVRKFVIPDNCLN